MMMDALQPEPPADGSLPEKRAGLSWRQRIATLVWTLCLSWPAWTLSNFHAYLHRDQQPHAVVSEAWQRLVRRFELVRQSLPAGIDVEYVPSRITADPAGRRNDVQFVMSPVIVLYAGHRAQSRLILADMMDDAELQAYVNEHALQVVEHFGHGLALLSHADTGVQ